MTSGSRVRTALLVVIMAAGLTGCADTADTADGAGAPGSVAGEGPARPAAGGEDLVVDALPLEAPVILDPVPEGLLVTEVSYNRLGSGADYDASAGGHEPGRATLYGDPDLVDTLDGPVLLVGRSEGSASLAGPEYDAPGEDVDLGGRTGRVVQEVDRTWVVIDGNDYREFVVGRGIGEDELVAAARGADFGSPTATLASDSVPAGLEPLIAGSPEDGPGGGPGELMTIQGNGSYLSVSVVRADPRLSALWGFWTEDSTGTLVRGRAGSVGTLSADVGRPEVRGWIWAEDGTVLAVVAGGAGDLGGTVDQVLENLRVGTWAEFEEMDRGLRTRPPTREESVCPPDGGFVSGVEGTTRWAFQLSPNPVAGMNEWITCYGDFTDGGGGGGRGGTIIPPPVGELTVQGFGYGIVGGVAPPGTVRVTVGAADGRVLEAPLSDQGPRPGERVWGTFIPEPGPPPTDALPFTVTAYDAAGAVLDSRAG